VSGRSQEVAERLVAKLFSGRRAGNVEVHLSRDEVAGIATASYDIGYRDGRATPRKPTGDEVSEKVEAARRDTETLSRLDRRSPTEQREAGAGEGALERAAGAQDAAIHALAQWAQQNEVLTALRLAGSQDLIVELRELLGAWSQASNAVLAATANAK
jgi:hypothetical protein